MGYFAYRNFYGKCIFLMLLTLLTYHIVLFTTTEQSLENATDSTDAEYVFKTHFKSATNYYEKRSSLTLFPELVPKVAEKCCKNFYGKSKVLDRPMEWDEWMMVEGLISKEDRVLEFGARYGTTSCVLSRATGNTGNVVSVEIDSTVWGQLKLNRDRNECSFHVVEGSVGDFPLAKVKGTKHYATNSKKAAVGDKKLPLFDYEEIEKRVGYKFNSLLIDCEGCVDLIFSGKTSKLLDQVELILIEHDTPQNVRGGYESFFNLLKEKGFVQIWLIQDTNSPLVQWSRDTRHSAWRKGGLGGKLSCEEFKKSRGYTSDLLQCYPI